MVHDTRILMFMAVVGGFLVMRVFELMDLLGQEPPSVIAPPTAVEPEGKTPGRKGVNLFSGRRQEAPVVKPMPVVAPPPKPEPVVQPTVDPFTGLIFVGLMGSSDQPRWLFRYQEDLYVLRQPGDRVKEDFILKTITPNREPVLLHLTSKLEKKFAFE